MKQNKRPKPESKPFGADAGSPKPSGRSPTPVGAGEARRLEQVSFRVRPELKSAILDEARRRRLTVQTIILRALRNKGVSVLDSDLEDLRQGAPRPGRTMEPMQSDRLASHSGPLEAPLYSGDLSSLITLLAAIVRPSSAQPANIVVTTTCGGRVDDRPQPESNHLNADRRD